MTTWQCSLIHIYICVRLPCNGHHVIVPHYYTRHILYIIYYIHIHLEPWLLWLKLTKGSLEDMLGAFPTNCVWHGGVPTHSSSCIGSVGEAASEHGISLGITGSPCNPFSTARTKRFADGSVVEHSMTQTTMASVVGFYKKFEPRAGITEQVKGFGMKVSSTISQTPMEQFLRSAKECYMYMVFVYVPCYQEQGQTY